MHISVLIVDSYVVSSCMHILMHIFTYTNTYIYVYIYIYISQSLTEPVEAPAFHRTKPERYMLVLFRAPAQAGVGVNGLNQRLTEPKQVCHKNQQ